MLLPSALSCDSSSSTSLPKPYYQSTTLFASPPISPSTSHSNNTSSTNTTISSLYSTCRALQSMLSPPPTQLPSPPTQHLSTPIISSPFKLRLRNRNHGTKNEDPNLTPRKKITKRSTTIAPRGVNKRRRAIEDDISRSSPDSNISDHEEEEHDEKENTIPQEREKEGEREGPRTPKRLRISPEILPLGLERSDFHALHLQHQLSSQPLPNLFPSSSSQPHPQQPFSQQQQEEEEEEWTSEQDRLLVELVLEKLKLSKSEWQDCARSLGKDRGSVGKRWKSLMGGGEVGLKGLNSRRGMKGRREGIYGSWR